MKKIGFVLFLLMTACSHYSTNGEQQYLNSKNGPPLVVPQSMTSANISHFYDLPPQTQNAKVSIAPPTA